MRTNISSNYAHSLAPIKFAESYAKAFAKKLGIKRWSVKVKVTTTNYGGFRGYRGRAWRMRNGVGRILLRIAETLPTHEHRYFKFADMPSFTLQGNDESIVYLAAHEFGHIIGWPGDKAGETACCKFGYAAVEAWRNRQYEHPACLI